ncbi:MAG: cohesin domain-containing protein, partial [Candidatus Aureabacteria bacterium]|nr:cohesin domain-containing protein [Candidatus Auribacterota bacterium]
EYVDSALPLGQTYYYRLTAVDTSGRESPRTSAVWATVGHLRVWMPDYRGKAGDEVRVRVSAENARGISSSAGMDIYVSFDPSVLTYVGIKRTAITEHLNVTANAVGETVRIVALAAPGSDPLVGEGHLFDVRFMVLGSVTPGQTSTNTLTRVKMLDSGGKPLLVDHSQVATFTVASSYILGDVNGDGEVSAGDAALAMQISVGNVSPTALQMDAGDINCDGRIDSADVVSIIRIAVGLPINPTEVASTQMISPSGGYRVSLPEASGSAGETVTIPLAINDAIRFSGSDIYLNYDSRLLTPVEVRTTELTGGCDIDWDVVRDGVIVITFGQDMALTSGQGNLVEITFRVADDAAGGAESQLKLSHVKLSGQYGDSLAWWTGVSTVDGVFRVSGSGPPTPTPPITVRLWTNQENYRNGDTLVLYYSLTPNIPEETLRYVQADCYLVLIGPDGKAQWCYDNHKGQKKLTARMRPVVAYPDLPSADGIAAWFRNVNGTVGEKSGAAASVRMASYQAGTYTWYAVLVWKKTDPRNVSYRISNVAASEFKIR